MRLKELRKEKGLLQADVAKVLSKTITCICDWERGRTEPSIDDLQKLANFFEVSVDYLIGREDDFGNIVVSSGASAELSGQEKELLENFNKLNIFERDAILIQVKALANQKEPVIKK